ncbi:MAG: GAF domain-containing protein [Synergistaceae bacterium]|nr:GAF domain-containing protein [Synergistaceae bacterium]
MKNGEMKPRRVFRRRKFWPQFLWLLVLVLFVPLGCALNSTSLLVAAILTAFLGLNESGRWSYKTNLLLCAVCAVAGTIGGVFTWFEMVSVFLLLFATGGFMLYYRGLSAGMVHVMSDLGAAVSRGKTMEEIVDIALEELGNMIPDSEAFIALTDKSGGLFLPESGEEPRFRLKENGAALWKVFASGRPYVTGSVNVSKDQPLWRDACSLMSIPLKAYGDKLGVLQVESDIPHAFSDEDLTKLHMVAMVIAQPLHLFAYPVKDSREETERLL